ncbi:hypothetical protein BJV82DRAFT_670599 [Fennellomyces sp. T-0311]|nr:hypothetical protein BJV82DRAFT_670599 [Fennellomyces sp. T-0311]
MFPVSRQKGTVHCEYTQDYCRYKLDISYFSDVNNAINLCEKHGVIFHRLVYQPNRGFYVVPTGAYKDDKQGQRKTKFKKSVLQINNTEIQYLQNINQKIVQNAQAHKEHAKLKRNSTQINSAYKALKHVRQQHYETALQDPRLTKQLKTLRAQKNNRPFGPKVRIIDRLNRFLIFSWAHRVLEHIAIILLLKNCSTGSTSTEIHEKPRVRLNGEPPACRYQELLKKMSLDNLLRRRANRSGFTDRRSFAVVGSQIDRRSRRNRKRAELFPDKLRLLFANLLPKTNYHGQRGIDLHEQALSHYKTRTNSKNRDVEPAAYIHP